MCDNVPAGTKRKAAAAAGQTDGAAFREGPAEELVGQVQRVVAKPYPESRGHTGYLLFARRIVEEADLPEAQLEPPADG